MNFFSESMKPALLFLLALAPSWADAQANFRFPGGKEIPLLSPAELQTVESQQREFANAFSPALKTAARSTVRIYYKNARGQDLRAAYGTVIGDGTKILTKWSEVANAGEDFRAGTVGKEVRPVKVTGVYPDHDVAILTIEGDPLTPVTFSEKPLELGNFLVASQPDGRAAGYGVVSVLERSLRAADHGYLGVELDRHYEGPGVKIGVVQKDSAAKEAGLAPGDIILAVSGREIDGGLALQNALWGAKPGTEVELLVSSRKSERTVNVILGSKPEMKQFAGDRLLQMERMGGKLSRVRQGFPKVVETDMVLDVENIGGPVTNLNGEVVGVTMSRAGRTRSYVMSGSAINEMLKGNPTDPEEVLRKERDELAERRAQAREARESAPRRRTIRPEDLEDLQNRQRHQGDMTKLMDRIQSELEALERGE
jgi:S1-C subfamily serine protease